MIFHVRVHPKVEKEIQQMVLLANAPSIAAKRADDIIRQLANGTSMTCAGRFSIIRDARLRNLYKFNLGKGYRLITIKEHHDVYILFIGDHDQCDRWLDANRKKNPHKRDGAVMTVYAVEAAQSGIEQETTCPQVDSIDEADLLPPVSQKDLRQVFCAFASDCHGTGE